MPVWLGYNRKRNGSSSVAGIYFNEKVLFFVFYNIRCAKGGNVTINFENYEYFTQQMLPSNKGEKVNNPRCRGCVAILFGGSYAA